MSKSMIRKLAVVIVLLAVFAVLSFVLPGQHNLKCGDCDGTGMVDAAVCELCTGTGVGEEPAESQYYSTVLALAPPIIAIVLALVTKEVTAPCSSAFCPARCCIPTSTSSAHLTPLSTMALSPT